MKEDSYNVLVHCLSGKTLYQAGIYFPDRRSWNQDSWKDLGLVETQEEAEELIQKEKERVAEVAARLELSEEDLERREYKIYEHDLIDSFNTVINRVEYSVRFDETLKLRDRLEEIEEQVETKLIPQAIAEGQRLENERFQNLYKDLSNVIERYTFNEDCPGIEEEEKKFEKLLEVQFPER